MGKYTLTNAELPIFALISSALTGPFRRFSMRMWQNARANTVRRAMECNVYFPFSKNL